MFNQKLKRIGVGLLAALLLASTALTVTSCGGDETDTPTETETKPSQSETITGPDGAYASVERPSEKYNRNITFVVSDTLGTDVIGNQEEKGETLADGLIDRAIIIEEDFGATLTVQVPTDTDAKATLQKQVSGNLDDFDVYYGERYTFAQDAQQNKIKDLNTVMTMDLYNPWWEQSYRENLVVDGRNFMITGDITAAGVLMTSCMVFNKQIMDDLKKEYPYDLVDDGEWTMDQLIAYTDNVTNDSLGRYGLTGWHLNAPFDLYYGAGADLATINSETGLPDSLNSSIDKDRFIKIYENIYRIIITNRAYFTRELPEHDSTYEMFTDGKALFVCTMLDNVSKITHMKDDYGLLPLPKYDSAQDHYRGFTNSCASVYMAITERTADVVGHVLEAMSAYSYEYITPKMYNIVIKSKDIRDPRSADMVDYIIEDRVFDFAWWTDLTISNVIRDELKKLNPSSSISSKLDTGIQISNGELTKLKSDWEKCFNGRK